MFHCTHCWERVLTKKPFPEKWLKIDLTRLPPLVVKKISSFLGCPNGSRTLNDYPKPIESPQWKHLHVSLPLGNRSSRSIRMRQHLKRWTDWRVRSNSRKFHGVDDVLSIQPAGGCGISGVATAPRLFAKLTKFAAVLASQCSRWHAPWNLPNFFSSHPGSWWFITSRWDATSSRMEMDCFYRIMFGWSRNGTGGERNKAQSCIWRI